MLGTGIDVVYPKSNARLFRRIAAEGLIVSEFPPGTPPMAANFPINSRRAALSRLAVLSVTASHGQHSTRESTGASTCASRDKGEAAGLAG